MISIISACLYYKRRYELKTTGVVDNDNLRTNLIIMQKNPSYVAPPTERVEVADYEYMSLKQQTT